MDFNIKLNNGQILKGVIYSPGDNIRCVIIMIHGLGEHIQRYKSWSESFVKEGIGFAGIDLPGHGRSDGKRGSVKSYSLFNEMIQILLKSCKQTFPGVPIFIYGHSLGGVIVLNYLLSNKPKISGAIVTSPWLKLSYEPPKIKVIIASMIKHIAPGLIQPSGLVVNHLSHDLSVVDAYRNDPLVHDKISTGLFSGVVESGNFVLNHASELTVPVLLLHGGDDMITSPQASIDFSRKSTLVELRIWEKGYHELHNETFKNEVFTYILRWINKKLN